MPDDSDVQSSSTTDEARQKFFRAIELANTRDYAAASPMFYEVLGASGLPAKAWDSCVANIAICAHHLGDNATALSYCAMFLDSAASPGPDERMKFLEMFFASYKGLAGIVFHNPYNEYD